MYWCTDVCTAVYITVSLYIDDVLMSVNSIHSLYHNITCQTTILESTEVLMMYRCTNVSLSISVFNVADHKQLSRWYTRCDVWCIHKLLYYYINYTLVCKAAVCKNYHFTVYWCTDVLMSVLLYISLYRCISMMYWCLYCCMYHCIIILPIKLHIIACLNWLELSSSFVCLLVCLI